MLETGGPLPANARSRRRGSRARAATASRRLAVLAKLDADPTIKRCTVSGRLLTPVGAMLAWKLAIVLTLADLIFQAGIIEASRTYRPIGLHFRFGDR
jgi:hypothetical protein